MRPRETTTILLSAYIDNDSAAKLNNGSSTLESTLILHTAHGKDDFIAVSGNYRMFFYKVFQTSFAPFRITNWQEASAYECLVFILEYTCFANSLERLTRLAGPIRELKSPEEMLPAGQAINAPNEIMRLINWLMTHVSATVCYHARHVWCA